jgi:hypothetical protein
MPAAFIWAVGVSERLSIGLADTDRKYESRLAQKPPPPLLRGIQHSLENQKYFSRARRLHRWPNFRLVASMLPLSQQRAIRKPEVSLQRRPSAVRVLHLAAL